MSFFGVLADLRAIRPWLYGATALLYVAVALRMLTVGLVGRYPWFWAYLLLQGLAVAPWGLVYDKPAMEPLVLRDPALWQEIAALLSGTPAPPEVKR